MFFVPSSDLFFVVPCQVNRGARMTAAGCQLCKIISVRGPLFSPLQSTGYFLSELACAGHVSDDAGHRVGSCEDGAIDGRRLRTRRSCVSPSRTAVPGLARSLELRRSCKPPRQAVDVAKRTPTLPSLASLPEPARSAADGLATASSEHPTKGRT